MLRGLQESLVLTVVFVFTLVSLLPENALAFESQVSGFAETALMLAAERDPYLAAAIATLPDYDYIDTGTSVVTAEPITMVGNWPTPVPRVIQPKKSSIPTTGTPVVLEGEASYYSWAGCLGCNPRRIMANGQPLNDNALTMAIGADKKHLVGRTARVTSLATGKSVTVRITDTGGFHQAKYGRRVADLTVATKHAIGMRGGVGQVRVEVF